MSRHPTDHPRFRLRIYWPWSRSASVWTLRSAPAGDGGYANDVFLLEGHDLVAHVKHPPATSNLAEHRLLGCSPIDYRRFHHRCRTEAARPSS